MSGKFERFGRIVDRCESFIERRFAIALLLLEQFTFEPIEDAPYVARDALGISLAQQLLVGAHRVDFALIHADGARLAIEIDGHEYHDGTKERAERDRARDRHLLEAKWPTVRYTGREINRDAMRCAQEAHRLIVSAVPVLAPRATLTAEEHRLKAAVPIRPSIAAAFAEVAGDDEAEMALAVRFRDEARARAVGKAGTG